MAASRRMAGGFKDPLSIGSAEYFDICCDPCKHSLGRSVEAKGFCVNCQENLCKRCVDTHKGLKLCRHHQILDQPQKVPEKTIAATDDSKICTEYCDIHEKEIIKFFCQEHDKVGCSDCMTLDHRTCRIDYIPDICKGTLKSKELRETLRKLPAIIDDADTLVKICQGKKDENKRNTDALLTEIEKYQKTINDRIDQLKQQLVKEANSHKTKQDQDVDKIGDTCARVTSELKQIYAALQDSQAKRLEAHAFVTMKKTRSIVNTTNIQTFKNEVANVVTNIFFQPNDQLKTILTQQNALGRLSLNGLDDVKPKLHIDKTAEDVVKTRKETTFDLHSIEQMYNIEVKTKSVEKDVSITGCAVISADRLLLADCGNNKLKVVNIDIHSVVEEIHLDTNPYDISVLPQDQAAVTLPSKQEILILETAWKLSRIGNLKVGRNCWGIFYHQNHLYIICQGPNSLLVLDTQGNIQRDIELNAFSSPLYIAVRDQTLYISDWKSNLVASLTLQGEVTGVYKHDNMRYPLGLVLLEDGSLLVCCYESGTIHYVSPDLKQGRTLKTGVNDARSLCYHAGNSQIYVGSWYCNQIKVFRIL